MPVPLRICASTDSTILAAPRQRPDSYSNPVVENTALAAGSLSALCAKELQKRLPLLLQAVAIGDTVTVHMESHAMRGVAANFGLATLAESLLLIEVSGGAKRVDELRVLAQTLPSDVDAAIEALLRRDA